MAGSGLIFDESELQLSVKTNLEVDVFTLVTVAVVVFIKRHVLHTGNNRRTIGQN